jgi:hypothetical protein
LPQPTEELHFSGPRSPAATGLGRAGPISLPDCRSFIGHGLPRSGNVILANLVGSIADFLACWRRFTLPRFRASVPCRADRAERRGTGRRSRTRAAPAAKVAAVERSSAATDLLADGAQLKRPQLRCKAKPTTDRAGFPLVIEVSPPLLRRTVGRRTVCPFRSILRQERKLPQQS